MHNLLGVRSTTTTVLLLIVSLGAVGMTLPTAEAQVPVFTISGIVYNSQYQPLSGAAVTVLKADGTSAGTATTDSAGKYSVGSLVSGTYNVSAAHACCVKEFMPVQVSGTDPTVQQNFRLEPPQAGAPAIVNAFVLKGVVRDASGAALGGVLLELYNYAYGDGQTYIRAPEQQYVTYTTAADGAYSFSVRRGSVNLNAYKDGFDRLHANFEMSDNRTLDIPMRKSEGQSVTIQGTITSQGGGALANAYINIGPDYGCGGGDGREVACAYPAQDNGGKQEGDVWFYYEPQYGNYNSTQTDAQGKYTMRVAPGNYRVSAWANDHRHADKPVSAKAGESKTVDFALERIPADSVRLTGVVRDARSGDPIPYATIHVENQQWGSYHYTVAKEDGSYELMVKPGYIIVNFRADEWVHAPCGTATARPEPMIVEGDAEGSEAPETTSASSKPVAPCDGGKERDQAYYPASSAHTVLADEKKTLDAKLTPRPTPDATFIGYVVNSTSQKAVPNAQVTFYNEFTRDWGQATTDEQGGYKIRVHAGYYTVRVYAEHYYDAVLNAEIRGGDERRLDIFVVQGERSYGGCCYAYGGYASMSEDSYGGSGAKSSGVPMAPQEYRTSGGSSTGGAGVQTTGQASYQGEASGLGEYSPNQVKSKGTSPTPVGLVVLAALGAVALVLRRRTA